MASLINGVKLGKLIEDSLLDEISNWCIIGQKVPQLVIILVGEEHLIESHVDKKEKTARNVGIACRVLKLPVDILEENLIEEIQKLNKNSSVDGISIQLPLPAHLNGRKICKFIIPDKDVDGFKIIAIGDIRRIKNRLDNDGLLPCASLAVQELLKRYSINMNEMHIVVVAKTEEDCLLFAMMLERGRPRWANTTVDLCISNDLLQLEYKCKRADVIVTAVGEPGLIEANMIKPGAVVVDAGISRIVNPVTGVTTLVGDLNLDAVREVAGKIITVPGDLGPMTNAILMRNTFKAAKKRCRINNYCSIQ